MKIVATNLGEPKTISWKGEKEQTGIFKYPVDKPLLLEYSDVKGDAVMDRKHHAGEHKACYLFSSEEYDYWKNLYPNLKWDWGMFGENLTVQGLDENSLRIGDIYKIGNALVQVSQPREPCYKLGIRFNDQKIVQQFVERGRPGTYVRVLKEGTVKKEDTFQLQELSKNELTVAKFYQMIYTRKPSDADIKLALNNTALPLYKRERLAKHLK
jgi:MOSC domain-containing protein YiiM